MVNHFGYPPSMDPPILRDLPSLAASPMHQRPPGPGCEWGPQRERSHDPTPARPVGSRGEVGIPNSKYHEKPNASANIIKNVIKYHQLSRGFTIHNKISSITIKMVFDHVNLYRFTTWTDQCNWCLNTVTWTHWISTLVNFDYSDEQSESYAGGQMIVLHSHFIHQVGWELEHVSNHPHGVAMSPSTK